MNDQRSRSKELLRVAMDEARDTSHADPDNKEKFERYVVLSTSWNDGLSRDHEAKEAASAGDWIRHTAKTAPESASTIDIKFGGGYILEDVFPSQWDWSEPDARHGWPIAWRPYDVHRVEVKPLSEEDIAQGWIAHEGGECPIDGSLEVRVRTVSDDGAVRGESTLSKPANEWDWSAKAHWRIFNYREVTAEEALENFQNRVSRNIWESAQVVDDKALKAAVDEGVEKLGGKTFQERLSVMEEPVTYDDDGLKVNALVDIGDGWIEIQTNRHTYKFNECVSSDTKWMMCSGEIGTYLSPSDERVIEITEALKASDLMRNDFLVDMPPVIPSDPLASTYGEDKAVPDALDQGLSLDDLAKSRTSLVSQFEKMRGLNDEPRWSHEEIIEHQRMLASKAMGDDKPAKDLRQSVTVPYPINVTKLEAAVNRIDAKVKKMAEEIQEQQMARFSHHDTKYTTHVFYDEHPIAMITDDVISWSYHMPDMKKAASEAMHVYLGRVWK